MEAHLLCAERRLFPNTFQGAAALLGPGERPVPAHLVETSQRHLANREREEQTIAEASASPLGWFQRCVCHQGVSPGFSTPVIQTPRCQKGCDSQPGLPAGSRQLLSQRNRTRRSNANNWLFIRAAGKRFHKGGVNFLFPARWFPEENSPSSLDSEGLNREKRLHGRHQQDG